MSEVQRLIDNARARFEYEITDTLTAGLVLTGAEVKSIRGKHGSLAGSHVRIIDGEAWLINAQVSPYPYAPSQDYDPKRTRKLLLRRSQLLDLEQKSKQGGSSLVPLAFVAAGRHIKLLFGIGKGRKQHDKRAVIRKREEQRELQRQFRGKLR